MGLAAAALPLLMGAIGAGLQAVSAKRQVDAQNQSNEYNATIAEQNRSIALENAQLDEQRADDAAVRGDIEEKQHRLRVGQMKGQQRSSLSASGAVVDSGSALDLAMDTDKWGEVDALTIRHNTAMEVWGHKMEARNDRLNADVFTTKASQFRSQNQSSGMAVASSLLTSGTSLMRHTGMPTFGRS